MEIFNKFCLFVGQIVVGIILGLVISRINWILTERIYETGEKLVNRWKMRKFEKAFAK